MNSIRILLKIFKLTLNYMIDISKLIEKISIKLNFTQSLKISIISLTIISPNLIASQAIADPLNSTASYTGRFNYTVTGGSLRNNPDDIGTSSVWPSTAIW